MKKRNYLIGLGFYAASLGSISAQTVIATMGFEDADKATKYACEYALTPGKSQFGDWVNVKDGDIWTEQSKADVFNGEYSFQAGNSDELGNTWDRGFKIGNLPIKENTPYRVSFWIKPSDTEYINANGENQAIGLNAWLSKGIENYDKSICSQSGGNYVVQLTKGLTDEWQRISFVSFYTNAEVIDNVVADQSWVGNAVFPEEFGGDGVKTYAEHFDHKLPNKFFAVINMFSPVEYLLDDIKIEEGVTFNQAQFCENAIQLDFGYPTNITALANANNGSLALDISCVSVKADGEDVEVEFVEALSDGYLYIFTKDIIAEEAKVEVSFTPAADCPIVYNSDRRPSADVDSEMQVLPFTSEVAYFNAAIDAVPASWSPASMVSSIPENNSFELIGSELKTITVTYDKALNIDMTSATLTYKDNFGTKETDLSDNIALSDDKKSIIVTLPNTLADNDYTLILSGVMNEHEVICDDSQEIAFSVGVDTDQSVSKVVYSTNETFQETANGTFPVGWVSNDNGTIHQYGLTETGDVWNYNWVGNIGGGGCRAMTGYSGDLNGAAIYWRSMNGENTLGTLTFGAQVKDFQLEDGTIDPEMDPNIALHLDAAKYQISIRMCAWKNLNGNADEVNADNAPKYTFTLEDLEGNVYARFDDVSAMPNVNGAQNKAVNNVTLSQTDFTVEKAGYYILKFSTTQPNGEYLLGGVQLITMPSKAAYYKQLLAEAADAAKKVLEESSDPIFDGETKAALTEAINKAETAHFTSPSEVDALIAELNEKSAALAARATNIQDFEDAIADVQIKLLELEEEGVQKYLLADEVTKAMEILSQYGNVKPSTLSDAVLAETTPKLKLAATQINNLKNNVDILTWGAVQAGTEAQLLGADALNAFELSTDDREVIDRVNANTKGALYGKIAAGEDLTQYMTNIYDMSQAVDEIPAGEEANYDEDGHPVLFKGINLSGYVANAHLYRVQGDDGCPGWTITPGSVETSLNIQFNATPSEETPVVDARINIYGNADYDFSQAIENLPAGIYNVVIQTRTPKVGPKDVEVDGAVQSITYYYNAQDENGTWDKYIYAQGDGDQAVAPYAGASGLTPTVIENVTVKDGKLTLGAHEHYVSGKAVKHEDNTPQNYWTGTTYVDYVNIYWVAPIEGFDYASEATDIVTINSAANASTKAIYSVTGAKTGKLQKGINIVKIGDKVQKVFVK